MAQELNNVLTPAADVADNMGVQPHHPRLATLDLPNQSPLYHYINKYTTISQSEFECVLSHFTCKRIRRRQYILQEGEVCTHLAFVLRGAMRKYHLDEKGIEHVVDLYLEDWWVVDRESFALCTPSVYNIEAWEDSEVLLITRESVLELRKHCAAFNEMSMKLDENSTIASQKRITSSISLTAERRYLDFIKTHPFFVERFPQHIIASYLGITKDTLSRVRRRAVGK